MVLRSGDVLVLTHSSPYFPHIIIDAWVTETYSAPPTQAFYHADSYTQTLAQQLYICYC